ncbi:hypothetical protein H696_04226 [Fonticula alba]|uniref:VPS9 domain-containing protein n=1 Tax=Fonticula alba TaxID=691883 RepID=A0A058Z3D7_FONAL|nr:hypothetical protein H696_04226 [Fonticula alba]KCV68809.1 hypothetical protein H696_04226 [Fonticula alba]|eukprot:XP_009496380.1 hypothetical protein H696_04226 [Fonticula alba]
MATPPSPSGALLDSSTYAAELKASIRGMFPDVDPEVVDSVCDTFLQGVDVLNSRGGGTGIINSIVDSLLGISPGALDLDPTPAPPVTPAAGPTSSSQPIRQAGSAAAAGSAGAPAGAFIFGTSPSSEALRSLPSSLSSLRDTIEIRSRSLSSRAVAALNEAGSKLAAVATVSAAAAAPTPASPTATSTMASAAAGGLGSGASGSPSPGGPRAPMTARDRLHSITSPLTGSLQQALFQLNLVSSPPAGSQPGASGPGSSPVAVSTPGAPGPLAQDPPASQDSSSPEELLLPLDEPEASTPVVPATRPVASPPSSEYMRLLTEFDPLSASQDALTGPNAPAAPAPAPVLVGGFSAISPPVGVDTETFSFFGGFVSMPLLSSSDDDLVTATAPPVGLAINTAMPPADLTGVAAFRQASSPDELTQTSDLATLSPMLASTVAEASIAQDPEPGAMNSEEVTFGPVSEDLLVNPIRFSRATDMVRRFQKDIVHHSSRIKALAEDIATLRRNYDKEWVRLQRAGLVAFQGPTFREFLSASVKVIQCRQKFHSIISYHLQIHLSRVQEGLEAAEFAFTRGAIPSLVAPSYAGITTQELISMNPCRDELRALLRRQKAAEKAKADAQERYDNVCKAMKSNAKHNQLLSAILEDSIESRSSYEHDINGTMLELFARIVASMESPLGRHYNQNIEALAQDAGSSIDSMEVINFMDNFTISLARYFNLIQPAEADDAYALMMDPSGGHVIWHLRLLIDRLVHRELHLPLWHNILLCLENISEEIARAAALVRSRPRMSPALEPAGPPSPKSGSFNSGSTSSDVSDTSIFGSSSSSTDSSLSAGHRSGDQPSSLLSTRSISEEEQHHPPAGGPVGSPAHAIATQPTLSSTGSPLAEDLDRPISTPAGPPAVGPRSTVSSDNGEHYSDGEASSGGESSRFNTDDEANIVTADQLMPLTTYCIIKARLFNPFQLINFLTENTPPPFFHGKTGYALATFETSVRDILFNLSPNCGLNSRPTVQQLAQSLMDSHPASGGAAGTGHSLIDSPPDSPVRASLRLFSSDSDTSDGSSFPFGSSSEGFSSSSDASDCSPSPGPGRGAPLAGLAPVIPSAGRLPEDLRDLVLVPDAEIQAQAQAQEQQQEQQQPEGPPPAAGPGPHSPSLVTKLFTEELPLSPKHHAPSTVQSHKDLAGEAILASSADSGGGRIAASAAGASRSPLGLESSASPSTEALTDADSKSHLLA